jgi:hypothetical protein
MDIQTRQSHLSEMGVPQWHARFTLVGAAVSPQLNRPLLPAVPSPEKYQDSPAVIQLEKMESLPLAVHVASEVVESLVGNISESEAKQPSSGVEALLKVSVEKPETITTSKFPLATKISTRRIQNVSLGAFVSDKYLVISEMGGHVSHLEEMSLLQNIIKVIDSRYAVFEFGGCFNWPVFNSAKVLVGQESLHEELIAWWLASFNSTQSRVLMCFGQQTKKIIENLLEGSSKELGECKAVFFGESLTDLYKAPLRKKEVWNVISENLEKFN